MVRCASIGFVRAGLVLAGSAWMLIACGGGAPPAASKPAPVAAGSAAGSASASAGAGAESASAAPGAAATISTETGDGQAAATTAAAYVHALAGHDWEAACATRLKVERDKLAQMAGSCARGLASLFEGQPLGMLGTASTGAARKRGATIAIDLMQPAQSKPVTTLFLQNEGGQWLLIDLPDSDAF